MRRDRRKPACGNRQGLTIVEVLCCVGILSVLVALITPAVGRARESSRSVECCAHLRDLGLALSEYEGTHRALPAGWRLDSSRRTAFGWQTAILPWLDQEPVAKRVTAARELGDPALSDLLALNLPIFQCPSDNAPPQFDLFSEHDEGHEGFGQASETVLITLPSANYVGVFGTHDPDDPAGPPGEGLFIGPRSIPFSEANRGLGNVMLVSERTARKLPSTWIGFLVEGEDASARVVGHADLGPNRDDADECELDSRHDGRIHVLWADGRVDPVNSGIDRQVYQDSARRRLDDRRH